MALFSNITRGGQVHIHQIIMIRQVVWCALLLGFCLGLGYLSFKAYRLVPSWAWQTVWEYHVAELNLATQPEEKKPFITQRYYPPFGLPYERSSLSIRRDASIQRTAFLIDSYLAQLFWRSLKIGGWGFLLTLVGWYIMGRKHRRKQKHRGNIIIPPASLARRLRWTLKASDLKIGKLPLVKGKETSHILITGTIGSGKSNTFHTLLPQIRKRGDKAIIVDLEGEMVARYYRQGEDLLLNPFDARSCYWDLWQELESEPLYEVFACAVIPPSKHLNDPFWENAARKVLISALKMCKEKGKTCPRSLYDMLVYSTPEEYEDFFKSTEAAVYTQIKGERYTLSIRGELERHLIFFKYLPEYQPERQEGEAFSIRRWIQSDVKDQWLFVSSKEDWLKALRPLISGWTDIATSALMSLPKNRHRRLWLVLDELPSLNALPCLLNSLARTRKYGGCIMAGVQNFKQLNLTYGHTQSEALLDLFNTKIFFRNTEPSTAEWVGKALGEKEETEVLENFSYGAHTMRDGVSLSQQTKRTPLVIATEVMTLPDFEAFVKFPGHYSVTKVKIPLQKEVIIAREFMPRELLEGKVSELNKASHSSEGVSDHLDESPVECIKEEDQSIILDEALPEEKPAV